MSERTPRSIRETAAWAVNRIAHQMQQAPTVLDAHGVSGVAFKAEDREHPDKKDQRYAALFPDRREVILSAPNLRVDIKNATFRAAQDGLEVTANDGSLRALFLRDGHIAVEVFPIPSLSVSEAALRDEEDGDEETSAPVSNNVPGASSGEFDLSGETSRDVHRRFDRDAARAEFDRAYPELRQMLDPEEYEQEQLARYQRAIDAIDAEASTSTAPPLPPSGGTGGGIGAPPTTRTPETEANPNRVKNLRGRVATEPNTDPTPQGKPRVQFVLAEHVAAEGDETTVFHRVYTLNKQAESLQQRGLAKGQSVGVDGYRQTRETKKKNGSAVQQVVIYANVVRTFGKRAEPVTNEVPEGSKE